MVVGAGSGKTRVLIYWIVYFIEEYGVSLFAILVIMFINKVVGEMRERVEYLVGLVVKKMWVFMFYLVCVCILCCDVMLFGYLLGFFIYD